MRALSFLLALSAGAAISVGAKPVQPRISMDEARAKALAQVPHGKVSSAELETEKGRLIYSFDIRKPGTPGVEEVQISALTGKLVSRKHESPAAEKSEARAEAHKPVH